MIAIVKYNAGNITSVFNALQSLGAECIITDDATKLSKADKVIFPGVGEAASAMQYLRVHKLDKLLVSLSQPVLGICLGLQLMCKHSDEGDTSCLGIFDTVVKKFPPQDKVPHMGWNNLYNIQTPLFEGINEHNDVYFVHSYYAELCDASIATCQYITPFSAAMHYGNFYAVQFHPEKSAGVGLKLLQNFLNL